MDAKLGWNYANTILKIYSNCFAGMRRQDNTHALDLSLAIYWVISPPNFTGHPIPLRLQYSPQFPKRFHYRSSPLTLYFAVRRSTDFISVGYSFIKRTISFIVKEYIDVYLVFFKFNIHNYSKKNTLFQYSSILWQFDNKTKFV